MSRKTEAYDLIDYLMSISKDRGAMVSLRATECNTLNFKALKTIGKELRPRDMGDRLKIKLLIAKLFAMHPFRFGKDDNSNFGHAMKQVAKDFKGTFQTRFYRLLEADSVEDIEREITVLVRMAKKGGAKINFYNLSYHLMAWKDDNEWVQEKWGVSFYSTKKEEKKNDNE